MFEPRLKKASTSVGRAVGPRQNERSRIRSRPLQVLHRALGNEAFGVLQAKMTLGQPGDKYEQEADRVADAVMRMPEPCGQRPEEQEEEKEEEVRTKPLVGQITPLVQRQDEVKDEEEEEEGPVQAKLLANTQVQRKGELEEDEDDGVLNAKSAPGQAPEVTPDLEARINDMRSSDGQPLDSATRAFMEPRFGFNFSRVRVHTGSRAAETARAVNAQAFTLASNVVFGAGRYAPETHQGKRLMAHELTHVVQQSGESGHRRNSKQSLTHEEAKQPNPDSQVKKNASPSGVPAAQPVMESCPLTLSSPRACPFGGACHSCPARVQAKLTVGQPGDKQGLEADRVADAVMRMPQSSSQRPGLTTLESADSVQGEAPETLDFGVVAKWIHDAIEEADEDALYQELEMLRHHSEAIRLLKEAYASKYRKTLEEAIRGEFSEAETKYALRFLGPQPEEFIPRPSCDANYCKPFKDKKKAEAELKAQWKYLAKVLALATPVEEDVWELYLKGGTAKRVDYSARYGKDFAEHTKTKEATRFLRNEMRRELEKRTARACIADPLRLDIKRFVPNAVNIAALRMLRFDNYMTVPGVIAGGIGFNQTDYKIGKEFSAHADGRKVDGFVTLKRDDLNNYSGTARITYTVNDTIDFCPGNCGSLPAQLVTVIMSRFEATGLSGDVPFTVSFEVTVNF